MTLANKYRLLRLIGSGGMGAVFEAENTRTGKRVALKLLLAEVQAGSSAEAAARFVREARAATRVEHPHIVQVFDMDAAEDGTLYIVQELLVGSDLRAVLERKRQLSVRETLEILLPIVGALVLAHREGVIHRDLKPENIFLARTRSGNIVPKVIDFGLAGQRGGDPSLRITRTGTTMGTPLYMSPEQAKGERDVDGQTDVWAMGAVFYECLSGRTPYVADSYNALIAQLLTEDAAPLASVRRDIDRDFAEVVDGALRRDRSRRYASMTSFLEALLDRGTPTREAWCRSLRTSVASAAHQGVAHAPTLSMSSPTPIASDETRGEQSTLSADSVRSLLGEIDTDGPPSPRGLGDDVPLALSTGRTRSTMSRRWGLTFAAVLVVAVGFGALGLLLAPQPPATPPQIGPREAGPPSSVGQRSSVEIDASRAPSHPCVALWDGVALDAFGGQGTATLLVSGPSGPRCGLLTQRWGTDVTCEFDLTDCRATGSGIDATGTTTSRRCQSPSDVVVECTRTQALLREGAAGDRTTATLTRRE